MRSTRQPLRVFVVWEPVIRTDVAPPTTGTLARIADSRTVQYWDRDRVLSASLLAAARTNPSWLRPDDRERVSDDGFVIWDAALVFPAGGVWETMPPAPSFHGGPVVDELDAIRAALGVP